MALQFVPTSLSDYPTMMEFMREVFGSNTGTNSFRRDVWEWKYFSCHPHWSTSRSHVLMDNHAIVAHGGVWPLRLTRSNTELTAIHLIDWAARRTSPGAGIQILRRVAAMTDIMLTVGGSPDTREILPKIGYQRGGVIKRYVRVVRPWLQLRTRPQQDWKSPLRFIRNAESIMVPLRRIPSNWKIQRVSQFDSFISPLLQTNRGSPTCPVRTPEMLNHMLKCPGGRFSAFIILDSGRVVAYFMFVRVGRQARIVDIHIDPEYEDSNVRSLICSTAARIACEDSEVCEVIAGTSSQMIGKTLERLGFRLRRQDIIFYFDPHKLLPTDTPLNLNLLDTDLSFFYEDSRPYIT